jgi:pimeloyl-ACP methyl ester carboxylesterase
MKNIAAYKDGSVISYAEYGDETGFPILINHGLIASIEDYELFERLIQLRSRLICIARPGYGESSPYTLQNIAEFAGAVEIVVDHLKLDNFDVLGMSSGAPYSYAVGYKFPYRVRNIYIFSGIPALYDIQVQAHWPFPLTKHASIAEMQTLARELFFSNLTAEDLERNDIRDSMRNSCFGIAQDLKIRCMDWGFSLSDVDQKVYMEHSRTDDSAPFITAQLTANLLPHCKLSVRENGEHFSRKALRDFIESTILKNDHSKAIEPAA